MLCGMTGVMGGRPERFAPAQVADALRESGGLIGQAGEVLGVDRRTVRRYLQRHPQLRALRERLVGAGYDALSSAPEREGPEAGAHEEASGYAVEQAREWIRALNKKPKLRGG
jgi:hypothetical protein